MKLFQFLTLIAALAMTVPTFADETKALAVLASDAGIEEKANACDLLGRIGTAKAVPALAELLADEKLHDYARDGLERIADPAAGKALLDAAGTLEGNLRVGVITTLGDRGDAEAIPALSKIAKEGKGHDSGAALASLAQIASDDSVAAILDVLANGEAKAKAAAARAALLAAQKMEKSGSEEGAKKLREAVAGADVPDYLKAAAK